jgi:hypothetical protein
MERATLVGDRGIAAAMAQLGDAEWFEDAFSTT